MMATNLTNTIRVWIEAARPRTLTASASPVLLGSALAWQQEMFRWMPAVLCLAVALLAQIASNFANDYFDFRQGADTASRLGPTRAVASGRIAPRQMLAGTFVALGAACLCGLCLCYLAGWWLLAVGILIAVAVLAYSAGPYPLAYNGWGDVCVLLFYGVVPVCFTFYVQTHAFSLLALLLSLAVGLLSVNILVVNNYRDYEQDRLSGKRTTIVVFGRSFGRRFYLANGLGALLLSWPLIGWAPWWMYPFLLAFCLLFWHTWTQFTRLEGRALNPLLGRTALNVLLYTLLLVVMLLG